MVVGGICVGRGGVVAGGMSTVASLGVEFTSSASTGTARVAAVNDPMIVRTAMNQNLREIRMWPRFDTFITPLGGGLISCFGVPDQWSPL
jgi:hypothetical protein